ncbi:ankyrin repeat-containing domain protein [Xylaria longipes]|nr:ankyrin repeat-containing domain protein [Xylaria longipes]
MEKGETPLHRATSRGNVDIVRCLYDAGAAIDSRTPYGETPLHLAAKYGNVEVVQFLLGAGAAVDFRTTAGETPLQHAVRGCVLYNGEFHADSEDSYHPKPLEEAPLRSYFEVIDLLVNAGASVDSAGPHGSTLFYASQQKDVSIVRCLIERATHKERFLNALYFEGSVLAASALWSAVDKGHLDVVRYLIEAGANPLLQCTYNGVRHLAIHRAFTSKNCSDRLEVIRYLIRFDRNQLEERTSENKTCLHLAVLAANVECTDLLLSKGADCTATTSEGVTPWKIAHPSGSLRMMGVFLRREIEYLQSRYDELRGDRNLKQTVTSFLPAGRVMYWGGNKLLYAALDMQSCIDSFDLTPKNYLTVLDKIHHSFVEHSQPGRAVCVREATCTFETLNDLGTKFMSFSVR